MKIVITIKRCPFCDEILRYQKDVAYWCSQHGKFDKDDI